MARFLITGANGLLGREVVAAMIEAGDEPIALSRTRPLGGVDWIAADLADPIRAEALPSRIDGVVHLAQSDRFNAFPEGAADVFAVNVASLVGLLEYARKAGAGAFVHASSGGLYGGGPRIFDEDAPLAIAGRLKHYLSTKRAAEVLADAYDAAFSVCALRYFFIYGRGQKPHMLMPRLAASVREGRALSLQGEDGMRLNPAHVADAAAATLAALKRSVRGIVNVAGPETVSIREIGSILGRALDRTPVFETNPGAPSDLVADIAKMRATLGEPKIAPSVGLIDVVR